MTLIATDPYFQQGWFHYQKSLYYISSVKNTWHRSREFCLQKGADLTVINSRAEEVGDGAWIWGGGGGGTESVPFGCKENSAMMVSLHHQGFSGELQEDLMDRTGGRGEWREVALGGWNTINWKVPSSFWNGIHILNKWILAGLIRLKMYPFFYSFSYWILGEPNNYEGQQEDCVEHSTRDGRIGWNDLICEMKNFFMCEKRIFP